MMSKTPDRSMSAWTAIAVCAISLSGCAALHPVPGVPIERLDACLLQPERPRTDERTIDLSLLGQPRPLSHVVDAGDVLGVFIEGVLGDATEGPPVVSPSLGATPGALTTATVASASLGYPVTVRDDGTISLPYKPPIAVRGLTMGEVELRIRETFSGPDGLLQAGRDRIFITLHKPRTVRVLVVRKDRPLEPSYAQPPDYRRAEDARGTAVLVELPAYENDVLHALVASGGLPGPDAENAVYVMRAGGAGCGTTSFGVNQFGSAPASYPGHGVPLSKAGGVAPWLPTSLSAATTATARPIHADAEFPADGSSTHVTRASGRVLATLPIPANVDPMSLSRMSQTLLPGSRDPFAAPHAGHGLSSPQSPYPTQSGRVLLQAALSRDPWAMRAAAPLPVGHGTRASAASRQGRAIRSDGHPPAIPPSINAIEQTGLCQSRRQSTPSFCQTAGFAGGGDSTIEGSAVRKIPLTVLPGESPNFCRSDVLLSTGDVIFIESRSREYFYTAGLLGGGKYPLPQNEDTDLLDAIALADSQRRVLPTKQVGGVSSLSQDITVGASKVIIFRTLGSGKPLPIKVDLNRLKRNPAAAPVILPGDRIVLQYTPLEAFAATIERHLLEGTVLGVASAVSLGNN